MPAKLYALSLSYPSQAARLMLEHKGIAFEDLRDRVEGRPAGELAMRLLPGFPGPIPPALPL